MASSERRALNMESAEALILERLAGESAEAEQPDVPARTDEEEAQSALEATVAEFDDPQGSDEVASEEDVESPVAESDETESLDEEVAEDADEGSREVYTVVVDGEAREVDLKEALEGYVRTETWTARNSEFNRERESFANEQAEFAQERDTARIMLGQLEELLQNQAGAEPDWVALARTLQPQEYQAQKAEWERSQSEVLAVRAERERNERELNDQAVAQQNAQMQSEAQLLFAAYPEFESEAAGLASDAQSTYGYRPEELNITDHRNVLVLRDAIAWRKLQAATPKVRAKAKTKSMDPGRATPAKEKVTRAEAAINESRARYKQTGSVNDAQRLIEQKFAQMRKAQGAG